MFSRNLPASASALALPMVLLACVSSGCTVVTVADAAASVAATTVKAGANVVGGAVDIARAGVRAASNSVDRK